MNPDTLNPGDTITLNGDTYTVKSLERTTYIGKDNNTLETQTITVTPNQHKGTPNQLAQSLSTHKQTYQVTQHQHNQQRQASPITLSQSPKH